MSDVIIIDTATPALRSLLQGVQDRRARNVVMASAATDLVRHHFRALAGTNRNPWGRPATFWQRMRASTTALADALRAAVVMPREIAARFFGTVIRPKGGKKFLTIPATARAYGRKAGSFSDLRFGFAYDPQTGRNRPALLAARQTTLRRNAEGRLVRRGTEDGTRPVYWLARSVKLKPNATILPIRAQFMIAIKTAMAAYLKRKFRA